MSETESYLPDFSNTEIAFSAKSDKELHRTYRLFQLMNYPTLVKVGSVLGNLAVHMPFHIFDPIIKATIFNQFCGGANLMECQKTVEKLHRFNTLTILDFGAEGKSNEEDFKRTLDENIKAIELAYSNPNVPVISIKLTAYISVDILEKKQYKKELNADEEEAYAKMEEKFETLCNKAEEYGVSIFVDAEESWIQDPVDEIVLRYMLKHNKERPVLYNTFQMYRKDRLALLKAWFRIAEKEQIILGAKIVRGAYMEKERKRAIELQVESPIHVDKASTDADYNEAIRFCVEHYTKISSCNATHNLDSSLMQADMMIKNEIPKDHPHLNFCQLYGMSDNITFNLAAAGYNVAKYVPYGPIKDVVPYLIRRAQENTSVTGDMSRELALLTSEVKRRKLI